MTSILFEMSFNRSLTEIFRKRFKTLDISKSSVSYPGFTKVPLRCDLIYTPLLNSDFSTIFYEFWCNVGMVLKIPISKTTITCRYFPLLLCIFSKPPNGKIKSH